MQNERSNAAIRRSVTKALIQRLRSLEASRDDEKRERAATLISSLQAQKNLDASF